MPSTLFNVGVATVGVDSGSLGTKVQSTNPNFPGITTIGNLISYSDLAVSEDPILARVISVDATSVTVVGVTTVAGVFNGGLPTPATGVASDSYKSVSDLRVLATQLDTSSDNTLYTLSLIHI